MQCRKLFEDIYQFLLGVLSALLILQGLYLGYSIFKENKVTTLEFFDGGNNSIWIYERNNYRCMSFDRSQNIDFVQGCMEIGDPNKVVFQNFKIMFSALSMRPKANRILIVGLGSAILPKMIRLSNPSLEIDVVEIDKLVAQMANKYFNFQTSSKLKLYIEDIYVFFNSTQQQHYDLIFMDAFNSDDVPAHLLSDKFAKLTAQHLTSDGILVVNNAYNNQLYINKFLPLFKFNADFHSSSGDVVFYSNKEFSFATLK
jgi:hypothetical protein